MFQFLRGGRGAAESHRLGKSALFAGLRSGELKIVESFLHERRFLAGEVIFDQGEEGQALYLILSGQVLICGPGTGGRPIARLQAGDFFGELAILDNSPRSAQARAGEDCELAVLFRGDFERLMESHACIASHIALHIARRLGQRLRTTVALLPAEAAGS